MAEIGHSVASIRARRARITHELRDQAPFGLGIGPDPTITPLRMESVSVQSTESLAAQAAWIRLKAF